MGEIITIQTAIPRHKNRRRNRRVSTRLWKNEQPSFSLAQASQTNTNSNNSIIRNHLIEGDGAAFGHFGVRPCMRESSGFPCHLVRNSVIASVCAACGTMKFRERGCGRRQRRWKQRTDVSPELVFEPRQRKKQRKKKKKKTHRLR